MFTSYQGHIYKGIPAKISGQFAGKPEKIGREEDREGDQGFWTSEKLNTHRKEESRGISFFLSITVFHLLLFILIDV